MDSSLVECEVGNETPQVLSQEDLTNVSIQSILRAGILKMDSVSVERKEKFKVCKFYLFFYVKWQDLYYATTTQNLKLLEALNFMDFNESLE